MSIKRKAAFIFLGLIIFVEIVELGIQVFVVLPSFGKLERVEAAKDVKRTTLAIDREIHHLDSLCHDWSAWDETYDFALAADRDYIAANLPLSTFVDNNLHVIVFLDAEGRTIWGEVREPGSMEKIRLGMFSAGSLAPDHFLRSFDRDGKKPAELTVHGAMTTERGPLLVSARPILTSLNEGPERGVIIMGRFFTRKLEQYLAVQTQVDFRKHDLDGESISGDLKAVARKAEKEIVFLTPSVGEKELRALSVYPGIDGAPAFMIEAGIPRDIWARGLLTVRHVLVSNLTAGVLAFIFISLLLSLTVLQPMRRLLFHIQQVRKTRDLSLRLDTNRRDEIGVLSMEFDNMLSELSKARKKLLEQHYFSGMAQMASGVIHNIRNQLHPVIGSLEIVRQFLSNLNRANEPRPSSPDEFSFEANGPMANPADRQYREIVVKSVSRLDGILYQLGQMEKILNEHENWAYTRKVVEAVDIREILDDAVDLLDEKHRRLIEINAKPGFDRVKNFTANRMTLLRIFIILLTNAAESIERKGSDSGTVTVEASSVEKNGRRLLRISFLDNGVGIAKSDLDRVFERNFSVKPEGASGIGLHWCANAMASMNGRIRAESVGEGMGAIVTLEWFHPYAQIEMKEGL